MDREGFRNRLKQYKKAREENPGLKYWEWRNAVSTEENPIYYSELEDLNNLLSEIEPLLNERKNIEQALINKRLELSEKHKVPYLKDKEITLTNAGSMTGARLTTNLLDSIAKYANKTGLSLLEAVGLAAQETTFGQNIRRFNKIYNNSNYDDYYVEDILSDWRYKSKDVNEYLEKKLNTPSAEAARLRKESFDYTMSKTNRMSAEEYEKSRILHKRELLLRAKDEIDFITNNYNDFEKAWSDYETKTVPPFEHAFQYYKTGKYNSGDPTHTDMVKLKGAEVMLSPEFKNWFKNVPKYADGTGFVLINSGIPWWLMVINSGEKVQPFTQTDIEQYENNELQRKLARSKYIMGVLSDIGASGKNPIKAIYNPTTGGDQQDVFLLNTKDQRRVMEQRGWKKVDTHKEDDPYGIVRTGAKYHLNKHSEVPVYENTADSDTAINREQLTKLFNVSNDIVPGTDYFGNAGSYNSVIYIDKNTGKFYSRSYDLNDYGPTQQSNGFISTVGDLKRKAAEKLDEIGTPFVIRTGFVPLNDYSIQHIANQNQKYKRIIDDAKASVEVSKILKKAEGGEVGDKKATPTQEEYIAEQIAARKAAALEKSLSRTMPRVPQGIKTGERWNPVTNKVEDIFECGPSCAYTFSDNYGLNWMGSEDFKQNHTNYGWKQVPWEQRQPGNAVLIVDDSGTAKHTMMYDSDNAQGQPLFNHSNGGHDESAIRKKAKYPHHNPYLTYKFVGTPADSTQWINDYKKIYGYADGGEVDQRQLILNRANKVSTNYSDAKDFTLDPLNYAVRKIAKTLTGRGGISNCTLSATGWVDPNNQYMSARNIFDNPDSGYIEIDKAYALPGDLLISKNPTKDSYHTMLIEGFNSNDPLLRYSRGGHDTEKNLVTGRSLAEYHRLDNEQGGNHTEDHYFRYRLPNEYWLPEIVVTPKK